MYLLLKRKPSSAENVAKWVKPVSVYSTLWWLETSGGLDQELHDRLKWNLRALNLWSLIVACVPLKQWCAWAWGRSVIRCCACLWSLKELTEAEVSQLWYVSTEQDTQTRKLLHVALKDGQNDNINYSIYFNIQYYCRPWYAKSYLAV